MADDEHPLAGHRPRQLLQEGIDALADLRQRLAAGRTREKRAERVPVLLQPRKRRLGLRVGHVVGVAAVAFANEEMMPDGHSRALLGRVGLEQVLERLHRSRVAGVDDVVERPVGVAQRDAGQAGLPAALVGQLDEMVRHALDGLAGLVVQVEPVLFLDNVALRLAVADEDEQRRTVSGF